MGGRAERNETSKRIPPARNPVNLNQEAIKDMREGTRRFYGSPNDKAYKATLRRRKKEEALKDQSGGMKFLEERHRTQLDRALGHLFEKNATLEEMDYIDRQGKVIERFTFPEGLEEDPKAPEKLPEVIITIVDFTRPVV